MGTRQQGFSLFDGLVVLAIVALLVAAGLPAYQHHMRIQRYQRIVTALAPLQSRITACMEQANVKKKACQRYRSSRQIAALPGQLRAWVHRVQINQGAITVYPQAYWGLSQADSYTLTPNKNAQGRVQWVASGPACQSGLLGLHCVS